MPANQTYNATQARTLESAVRTISVAVGSVVVTPPEGFGTPFTLLAGQGYTFDPKPVAGLTIFSPNSARIHLTYGDDAPDTEAKRNRQGSGKPAAKRTPAKKRSSARKPAAKRTRKSAGKKA